MLDASLFGSVFKYTPPPRAEQCNAMNVRGCYPDRFIQKAHSEFSMMDAAYSLAFAFLSFLSFLERRFTF